MSNQQLENNLKSFLTVMVEVEDSHEVLQYIFEHYLSRDDKSFQEMIEHLSKVFKINPHTLLDYLFADEDVTFESLGLNVPKYRNAFKLVSKIKLKYGRILYNLFQKDQDPFILKGAEINVKQNESTHKMKIVRADGASLDLNFKPQNILPVNLVLTHGLIQSIKTGIFNLDQGMITHYLAANEEINEILKTLLKQNADSTSDKEIALNEEKSVD